MELFLVIFEGYSLQGRGQEAGGRRVRRHHLTCDQVLFTDSVGQLNQ